MESTQRSKIIPAIIFKGLGKSSKSEAITIKISKFINVIGCPLIEKRVGFGMAKPLIFTIPKSQRTIKITSTAGSISYAKYTSKFLGSQALYKIITNGDYYSPEEVISKCV